MLVISVMEICCFDIVKFSRSKYFGSIGQFYFIFLILSTIIVLNLRGLKFLHSFTKLLLLEKCILIIFHTFITLIPLPYLFPQGTYPVQPLQPPSDQQQ